MSETIWSNTLVCSNMIGNGLFTSTLTNACRRLEQLFLLISTAAMNKKLFRDTLFPSTVM